MSRSARHGSPARGAGALPQLSCRGRPRRRPGSGGGSRAERAGLGWEQVRPLSDAEVEARLFKQLGRNEPAARAAIDFDWVHHELRRVADAICDRLVHNAHVLALKGNPCGGRKGSLPRTWIPPTPDHHRSSLRSVGAQVSSERAPRLSGIRSTAHLIGEAPRAASSRLARISHERWPRLK
jgi:hypothetical protein